MKWVYTLLALAGLLSTLAAILAYSGLFVQDSGTDSAQFISAAAFLAASAGWIVNNAVSLRLKLRESSLNYMGVVAERNDEAANLNKLWVQLNIDDLVKNNDKLEEFYVKNTLDHPFFISMRKLANSYEEMAVAIKIGAVEPKVLRRVFGTSFLWFWSRLAPFLRLYRNDPPIANHPRGTESIPKTFSHCEWLAKKWRGKEL